MFLYSSLELCLVDLVALPQPRPELRCRRLQPEERVQNRTPTCRCPGDRFVPEKPHRTSATWVSANCVLFAAAINTKVLEELWDFRQSLSFKSSWRAGCVDCGAQWLVSLSGSKLRCVYRTDLFLSPPPFRGLLFVVCVVLHGRSDCIWTLLSCRRVGFVPSRRHAAHQHLVSGVLDHRCQQFLRALSRVRGRG